MIDWNRITVDIYNFVRALTYPGAFSFNNYKRLVIWGAHPFSELFHYNYEPDTVLEKFPILEFLVETGDGSLLVTQYEGGAPDVGERLFGRRRD